MTISIEQVAIDLAAAGGPRALIGFERQWRNRLAGLRTNTLIALGSAGRSLRLPARIEPSLELV
jgi:putative Mg2+ transporter-C (MgtC) family protein